MAVENNKVQFSAGLVNTYLTDPPVGSVSPTASIGFTPGDVAKDEYVVLSTSPTALNSDLNGNGLMKITNANVNTTTITILSGATEIGKLPGVQTAGDTATSVLIPVGDGIIINATASAGTPTIGVTLIKISDNA